MDKKDFSCFNETQKEILKEMFYYVMEEIKKLRQDVNKLIENNNKEN